MKHLGGSLRVDDLLALRRRDHRDTLALRTSTTARLVARIIRAQCLSCRREFWPPNSLDETQVVAPARQSNCAPGRPEFLEHAAMSRELHRL